MNINQNFGTLKSDFTEPLGLIKKFIKLSNSDSGIGIMKSVGSIFILKLLKKSSNTDQSLQALKILKRIIVSMDEAERSSFLQQTNLGEFAEKLTNNDAQASTSSQQTHKQLMRVSHEANL